MGGLRWPHGLGQGQSSNGDVTVGYLEALIGDISLMEEPARRWHQHKEERQTLTNTAAAEKDFLRERRPRLSPLVLARAVAGHAPCITAASNGVVLQHNATLLLPDSVVSELGDFATWFSSVGVQHGRGREVLSILGCKVLL